jgi:hypothetical protein
MTSLTDYSFFDEVWVPRHGVRTAELACRRLKRTSVKNGVSIDRHRLAKTAGATRRHRLANPFEVRATDTLCTHSLPALVSRSQWPQSHPSSLRAAQAHLRSRNIHHLSTSPANCCHLLFPFHPMLPLCTQHSLRPPLLPSTPIPSSSHGDALSILANHPFWTPFSVLSTSRRAHNNSMFSQSSRLMEQMIRSIPFAACTSTV